MNNFTKQLPLSFRSTTNKTFSNFQTGNNSICLTSLATFLSSNESLFYLWGSNGAGKSHVLQAIINSVTEDVKAVILQIDDLSLRENVSLIEIFDIICIDNVENIAGDKLLEEALFFWINEVKAGHKKIIFASSISNNSEKWNLADLVSRIQSGRTHEILALERNEALTVFTNQAKQKGMLLDDKTIKYIENNCPMNMKYLTNLLEKLDQITLAEKKPLTIPLLKKILQTELV